MQKVKDTIPVYDICSISGGEYRHEEIIAERFADYLQIHPNLHKAHGHSFYHLVIFTKGGGYHTIDFKQFPVEEGQVYFMAPGQVHSWSFEGEVDGYVINFSESLFQSFLADQQYLERFRFFSGDTAEQVIKLRNPELEQAVAELSQVAEAVKSRPSFYLDVVRLRMLMFFILAARSICSEQITKDKALPNLLVLQNFRKLVNQYYAKYKLPKDYAAMLYVTPNYLNALCRELLGKSAGELIRARILLEAKRQLVNLDESIAGIGYNLGFTDNSYFTKFFKKYAGITPEEFRRDIHAPVVKN